MTSKPIMGDGPFSGPLPEDVRALVLSLTDERVPPQGVVKASKLALAIAEGLGPLLGSRIAAAKLLVPEEARADLVWTHQMCMASNLVRTDAVDSLANVYASCAIPIVLLKGMALIQSGLTAGERSMADVDILVPPSRWREACDLAAGAGYEKEPSGRRPYTVENDYVRSFTSPGGVVVEIHRFVCEQSMFSVDYQGSDGLFARARGLRPGVFVPDSGDLFLTLAAHAAKHTFELPLRSYVDGLVLLRRDELSMGALAARAKTWRMQNAFAAWVGSLNRFAVDGASVAEEHRVAKRVTRLVWGRTSHQPPWQRLIRMAWLMDSSADWAWHVATRSLLRAVDAVQSPPWLPVSPTIPSPDGVEPP
ncbi:MAG: nucleotidyltransferase family protein [Deltaproteobacteria bacterium]|nr:nucleotidyltransferase family protein [Deltaproteobacteria bacterium]